jgi:archaeal type IV pilus assembly protein PilA
MTTVKLAADEGVSPVVGVMLMLVVTIIVAAIVSAFAGGLATGTSKTPQMSISATFSNSSGMVIHHVGGDSVNTLSTRFIAVLSNDFGTYNGRSWTINSSVISVSKSDGNRPWNNALVTSSYNARTFQPGETATIDITNLTQVQPRTYSSSVTNDALGRPTDAYSSYYGFMNRGNSGQRFTLELVDNSGKVITQTEVTINP